MKLQLVLIILLIAKTNTLFDSSLKQLRAKAKKVFDKQYGKDKTTHWMGHDLTEYPGTNKKYRKLNEAKWEEYYLCLKAEDTKLGQDYTVTPEAVESLESTSIKFQCKICLSPLEQTKLDAIEWDWAPAGDKNTRAVLFSEHMLVSPVDKSLQIYNLEERQTGQYLCRLGEAQSSPYFLTVVPIPDEEINEVHSSNAPNGPYPQPVQAINSKLVVTTEWGPWSLCNKCNKVGKRHKLGYCTVQYQENSLAVSGVNASQAKPISDDDYELLKIFSFGIPCSSHILPNSIKKNPVVKARRNEVMAGYCKTDCPDDKIFEVRDKSGKVIERVNNSAGIYSVLQGMPQAQPSIDRQLQYAVKDKPTVLTCPGNLNTDTPVHWQIGNKKLIAEKIAADSEGRIYISITDKIHIRMAKLHDSNIYSCWQHQDLAGTLRLIVEEKFELNFNHHIMLLGLLIVFGTFFYFLIKVAVGHKTAYKAKREV